MNMIELLVAKNCGNCRHNRKNVDMESNNNPLVREMGISYCELHKMLVANQLICASDDWEASDSYARAEMNMKSQSGS